MAYELLDILRIQVTVRQVESEAIMRYVANPENIDTIISKMQGLLTAMKDLYSAGGCPSKWVHTDNCKCEPQQL